MMHYIWMAWIRYRGMHNKGTLPMTVNEDIELQLSNDHTSTQS